MPNRITTIAFLFSFALLIAGCGPVGKDPFDPAAKVVSEGRYENRFLGLSLTYPTDWVVADEAILASMQDRAASSSNAAVREAGNTDMLKALLFSVSQHELGTQGVPNPSFGLAAVKIPDNVTMTPTEILAGVQTALRDMKKLGLTYSELQPIRTVTLNGNTWHRVDSQLSSSQKVLRQTNLVAFVEGYAITMTLTAHDQAGIDELDKIVNSVSY